MSLTVLTNASSGAPRNSGTNGDLCALLDWALPQEGWAIEYTATNARVYRPASGNRFRLHVRHDSAVSGAAQRALVRGCESASSATSITDPFPLVAKQADANANWLVSTTASTVDRPFRIYVSPTFLIYCSQVSSVNNEWFMGMFGDPAPAYGADPYGTMIATRGLATNVIAASNTGIATQGNATLVMQFPSAPQIFWCRDITGATKSTIGQLFISTGAATAVMGGLSSGPSARAGYLNKIYREKVAATCLGSTTTAASTLSLLKRGWIPQLWNPLHLGRGAVNDVDTFTDTAYDPTAAFRMLSTAGAVTSGACCIIEETDTWSPP